MVARSSKRNAALLREATVRDVDDDVLVLVFKHNKLADMLSSSPEFLLDAMYEVLGGRWQVRCEVGGDERLPGGGSAGGNSRPGTAPRGGGGTSRDTAKPDGRENGGWPEPARPGGATAQAGGVPADGDWPEAAQPGSALATAGTSVARPPVRKTASARSGNTAKRGGLRAGSDKSASDTGGWAGEPPYDPEYDGQVSVAPVYEGFDPGDEPLDEVVSEHTARQTSEQQALQLLKQALGAEKIGEI
jgi:DNA polymerase-3 subunit gamma/tau